MKSKFTFLLSLIILICITALFSTNAYADNKQYEISNANFYVTLDENGDAIIQEQWTVKYTKGDFTRFYKDIYKKVSDLEKFTSIKTLNCKINGKEVPLTESSNRKHNHYYIEDSTDALSINWFYQASHTTVEYEITYVLSDIVKKTDDNKAIFCYRFIGENFEKKVKNTYVEIILPSKAPIELKYGKENTQTLTDYSITLEEKNSKNLLKYAISTNSDIFKELQYIPSSNINFKDTKSLSINDITAFIPIIIVVWIVLINIIEHKKQKKFDTFIKENPTYIDSLIEKYNSVHPLILLETNNKTLTTYQKFVITLLDLCRRKEVYISKEQLIIKKNISELQNFEKITIDTLLYYFDYTDNGNEYILDLNSMGKTLKKFSTSIRFGQKLNTAYKSIHKNGFYSNNEEIKFLTRYFKTHYTEYNNNAFDYFKVVERTHTIDYILILGFAFVKYKDSISSDSNFAALESMCRGVDFALRTSSNHYSSSSSGYGCSSCSSCSSCGGCGGGGAD